MKNLSGFSVYGFVLAMAFFSLIAVIYAIQARAKEWIYYRELANQRVAGINEFIICGGPDKITCEEGYECKITNTSKSEPYGKCTL